MDSDNTNVGFISRESRQPQPSPRQKKQKRQGSTLKHVANVPSSESSKLPWRTAVGGPTSENQRLDDDAMDVYIPFFEYVYMYT